VNLDFSDAELAFQAEARAWLAANVPTTPLPSMDTAEGFAAHRAWERRLADARWSVVSWPEEYGGRGGSLVEWVIFEEEYYRAGAPGRVSQNGIFLLAPILFDHGTPEQQQRFLPSMATGERIWAQAWSEPEAGSDLASLRSTATRTDGGWKLSGQKTWSSRASYAHWGFGLFRSDPAAERHRGLTYFLFPLDAPGVTVRPIAQLDGDPGFAEIFFDDVFVPDSDVLGAPGEGWRVAMSTAGNERGLSLRSPGRFCAAADRLVELWSRYGPRSSALLDQPGGRVASASEPPGGRVASASEPPGGRVASASEPPGGRVASASESIETTGARVSTSSAGLSLSKSTGDGSTGGGSAGERVVDAWIKAQAYRLYTWGTVTRLAAGGDLGPDGSVNKVFWSELDVALHETALDLLGPEAEVESSWTDGYMFSLSGPIYAGTNEIQRNIVAERILGLPREPKASNGQSEPKASNGQSEVRG